MTRSNGWGRVPAAWLVVGLGAAVVGCGDGIAGPGPALGNQESYELRLEAGSADLQSVLLEFSGTSGQVTVVPDHVTFSRVISTPQSRALLVGDLAGGVVLRVRTTAPGTPPTAVALDASAGATTNYAGIAPTAVKLSWTPAD